MSPKHLHRYITEFEGRHNDRELDTINQLYSIVTGVVGDRLRYTDLIAVGHVIKVLPIRLMLY